MRFPIPAPVRRTGAASVARGTHHLDHDGRQGRNLASDPVGFLFQYDSSILIYNMVSTTWSTRTGSTMNRINHVVDRPQVALHFDGDGTGGDIVVFTGTACSADDIPPPHENRAFLAKYGDSLLRVSDSVEEFGKRFPVPLRIEITRTRGF